MGPVRMTLGERIRKLRELHGWRLADLGATVGVSKEALSQYERGQAEPRWWLLPRLMKAFDVDLLVFTRDEVNWREIERQYHESRIQELYKEEPDIIPYKGRPRSLLIGGVM